MSSTSNPRDKTRHTAKYLDSEIQSLKQKVREAYSILAKKESGYTPTEKETEIVEEKDFNVKLISKLEIMKDKVHTFKAGLYFPEEAYFSVFHLFYLVRLLQQGYFGVISHKYPALEPIAVRYICDKLITASLFTNNTTEKEHKRIHRKVIFDIVDKLRKGSEEPVGPGFKTTFKYITDVIQDLIQHTVQTQPEVDTSPPPQVWIMMPYTSMIDSFGLYPSLANPGGFMGPIPSTLRSASPSLDTNTQEDSPNTVVSTPSEVVPDTVELEEKSEVQLPVKPHSRSMITKPLQGYAKRQAFHFANPDLFEDAEESVLGIQKNDACDEPSTVEDSAVATTKDEPKEDKKSQEDKEPQQDKEPQEELEGDEKPKDDIPPDFQAGNAKEEGTEEDESWEQKRGSFKPNERSGQGKPKEGKGRWRKNRREVKKKGGSSEQTTKVCDENEKASSSWQNYTEA